MYNIYREITHRTRYRYTGEEKIYGISVSAPHPAGGYIPVQHRKRKKAWLCFGCRYIPELKAHRFIVWAPNAQRVSLVGSFNGWDRDAMPMEKIEGGVWVCFAEGIENGTLYKYCVTGADGRQILKSDPFAAYSQTGSETASIVWNGGDFRWGDGEYMQRRAKRDFMTQPMSIYELHLGSWKNMPGERPLYRELADALADYCTDMGYTHIEIMPVTEYPLTRHGAIRSRATTRRPRATAIPTISSTSSTGCTKLGSR